MKLLIMAIQFKGGSLQGVVSIIRELVKYRAHEYYIVLSKEVKAQLQGIDFPENMHLYNLPYKTNNHTVNQFLNRSWFSRLEKMTSPDCVLCTSGPMYWKSKAPCLIGFNLPHHIYPESPYFETISFMAKVRWFLRRVGHRYFFRSEGDAFFVQTDDVNTRFQKYIDRKEVYTIPNTYSVSYRNIEDYPEKLPPRQEGEIRCLTISAYYPHKNLGIISKVVDALEIMGRNNIRFVVTLPKERYDELFSSHYKDRIINVGFVPSKEGPSLYKECDIMFLPTLLECFSASYAEAMVMQKPIITSDMGFAHCVCKDAAVYFKPMDVDDITTKLVTLIDDKQKQDYLISKEKIQLNQFGTSDDRTRKILELCKELVNR